jgi:hypothetical protein
VNRGFEKEKFDAMQYVVEVLLLLFTEFVVCFGYAVWGFVMLIVMRRAHCGIKWTSQSAEELVAVPQCVDLEVMPTCVSTTGSELHELPRNAGSISAQMSAYSQWEC